jgi:two-component sensor histidine kinase
MESIALEILNRAKLLTDSPHGYVSEIDPNTGDNVGFSLTNMMQGECDVPNERQTNRFPKGSDGAYPGLWGVSLNTRRTFITNSAFSHPSGRGVPEGHIAIDRFLSVPVMLGKELVGQIALANKPDGYDDRDIEATQRVAHYYALAIQRVRNEEQIRASLKEKQILLQEINHRVKNNLAVIISLLNLQANKLGDEKVKAAFQESQARIRSMSLIHETLYQSDNLAELDLKKYIRSLVRAASNAYSHTSSRIRFEIRADKIDLPLDFTVPCGLVLNELVSNSIKHAFPHEKQGEIVITAQRENDEIVLIVADNGVGFPHDVKSKKSETLGMFLVVRLVESQLKGAIDMKNENGAKVSIRFKAPKDALSRGYKNISSQS